MNSITIHTAGIEKERIFELLAGYNSLGIEIKATDNNTITTLEISAKSGYSLSCEQLEEIKNDISRRLGQNIFDAKQTLQENVVEMLKLRGMKLATAESCTSGIISSKITEINGASSVFDFGISAYSNEIKMNALNVQRSVLDKFGAVSSQTAAQMAIGAMRISGADIGLSVTGVAGPMTSEGKPVGLIYLGLCDKYGLWVLKLNIDGNLYDREQIRERAANIALDLVRRHLTFENFGATLYRGDESYCTTTKQIANYSVDDKSEFPNFVLQEIDDQMIVDVTDYAMDETDSEFFPKSEEYNLTEKPENRQNFKFLKKILPWIGDSTSDLIRKMVAVVLCLVSFAVSFWLIIDFTNKQGEIKLYEDLYQEYNAGLKNFDAYYKDNNGVFKVFTSLYEKNNNFCGWIINDAGDICSPVMRSDYNYYYSNHNFYNEHSGNGSIYTDADCNISPASRSQNIILYGKNAANGTVFGNLDKYLEIEYYKSNPTIRFDTLYQRGEYVIVAVVKLESIDDFNYRKTDFANLVESSKYVSEFMSRSIFTTNFITTANSDLLTLVTDIDDDSRILVFARPLTAEDDINELTIDVNIPVK